MHGLAVRLFGKCSVILDGEMLSDLHPGKGQEIFCYLLLQRSRIHSREALASLFWGNSSTQQSKKYLRTALWQIRNALKEPEDGGLLLVTPDSLQVNPSLNFFFDVAAFEKAYLSGQPLSGQALNGAQLELLRGAAELYRGDLLEGCYEDWCLDERERLQSMYLVVLDRLLHACEVQGDLEQGWSYGNRILRYDPASERTHQRLMRLYYAAGDRAAAVRQYRRCAKVLKTELGVQPSRETLELYENICSDTPRDARHFQPPASSPETGLSSIEDILPRLRKLRRVLFTLQAQLAHNVRILDRALDSCSRQKAPQPARPFSISSSPRKKIFKKDAG